MERLEDCSMERLKEYVSTADELFVDEEYESAAQAYTDAIKACADDAPLLVARARRSRAAVHAHLGRHQLSADDAAAAAEMQPGDALAHKRLGLAAFALADYPRARAAFCAALEHSANDDDALVLRRWARKCDAEMAGPIRVPGSSAGASTQPPTAAAALTKAPASSAAPASAAQPPRLDKVRHEWYETQTHAVVNVLVKNVPNECVKVDYEPTSVALHISIQGQAPFELTFRLHAAIDPEGCACNVSGAKIELKLKKATPGKWAKLEGDGGGQPLAFNAAKEEAQPRSVYSGSRRDWSAVEQHVKREEEEEKPEGEEALNKLFRDIYARSDEATRRAMNKSFQTSGGTVLSTNWGEVSEKDYEKERTAPEGQEWKKWG